MDILHGLERALGYILLVIGLPAFITLYSMFSSQLLSPSFLQGISATVLSFTGNPLLASLAGFFVSANGLFLVGALAIFGAALIFLGSKGFSGFSKVGTEIVILSGISLISLYAVTAYVLPSILSGTLGQTGTAVGSAVSSLFSPLLSATMALDIIFLVLGAGLIIMKFVVPYVLKMLSSKNKKSKSNDVNRLALYKWISLPAGVVVMLFILSVFTIFNSALLSNATTYSTTPAAPNRVSFAFQQASTSPAVFNLSDYYLLKGPNQNMTSAGKVTMSFPGVPLQFSLPTGFSISKFGDPIRLDFNIDLSQFNGLLNSVISRFGNSSGTSGFSIPTQLKFTILYNDSGIVICSNLNSSAIVPLQCDYQPINMNISKVLLNINDSNANHSILGQLFNVINFPELIVGRGSLQATQYVPRLKFVNHVAYNGNDCSLFDLNGTNPDLNTTGQVCLSDTSGLPLFLDMKESILVGNQVLSFGIDFGFTSINNDITLQQINAFPDGTVFGNQR